MRPNVGERLLTSKLEILSGAGSRRPSLALSILTGRVAEEVATRERFEPVDDLEAGPQIEPIRAITLPHRGRRFSAHTVYLSQRNLNDVERIMAAWQRVKPSHLTRSAVVRRALEYLRAEIEADPAKNLLEYE
jgi:hypothetical protein